MRRFLLVLAALAAASAVAATATASTRITAPPSTYTSPSGDSGTAPDIVGASATNDDHGLYTITVTFATPFTNAALLVFLDTDRNQSTGDSVGADYLIAGGGGGSSLGQWSASANDFVDAPASSTLTFSTASDQKSATITINKSQIGNSAAFDFELLSIDATIDPNADPTGHYDETNWYTYTGQTVYTLSVAGARATAAKAGGTWTIAMAAVRSDTNKTVGSEATIACTGTAGGKKLASSHAIVTASGVSVDTCTFRVPKADKGKTLHGTITVSAGGQTATHAFTAKAK